MKSVTGSQNLFSRIGLPLLLAAAFGGVVFGLRATDVWNAHFSETGSIYVRYHVLRTLFFLLMAWLVYYSGHLTLRVLAGKKEDEEGHGDVLNCFLAGGAVLSLLVLVLGLAGFLYFPLFLGGGMLLAAASSEHLRMLAWRVPRPAGFFSLGSRPWQDNAVLASLWVLTAAAGTYIFLAMGIGPDVGGETISYYFPYFYGVFSSHSLWPTPIFPTYFVVKGSGLLILYSILTDVQSLSLATFLDFLLMSCMLYRAVRLSTGHDKIFPLLAVFVFYCGWDIYIGNFDKSHIICNTEVLALLWFSMQATVSPYMGRNARTAFVLTAMNIGLLPLIYVFFGMAGLCVSGAGALLLGRGKAVRIIAWAAVVVLLSSAAMCTVNYLITGLFDVTGMSAQLAAGYQAALARWASPLLQLLLHGAFTVQEASLTLKIFLSHFNPKNLRYFFWDKAYLPYIPVIGLFVWSLFVRKNRIRMRVEGKFVLFAGLAMLAIPYLLASCYINDNYFMHGTVFFKSIIKDILYGYMLYSICKFLVGNIKNMYLRGWVVPMVVVAAVLVSIFHFPHNMRDDMREVFEFATGKASYEARYARTYLKIPLCEKIIADLNSKDSMVLPLNYMADCNGLPGSIFADSYCPPYGKDFDVMIQGAPDDARIMLRRAGITHVLIKLQQEPLYIAFLPLFSPKALADEFKLTKDYGDGNVLLEWNDNPAQDRLPEEFLQRYAGYLRQYADSAEAKSAMKLMDAHVQ
jgi:hypothetical protein